MTFVVKPLVGPSLEAIFVETIGLLTKEEALDLAVALVHVADGQMVKCMSSTNGVERWNEDSAFHRAYRSFMEDTKQVFG